MLGQHLQQVPRCQRVGNQGHARQRQPLAAQGGLGNLVRVVEIQPALGLQLVHAVDVQPAPPAQPFQVGGAVCVAGLDQGELGHVGRCAQLGLAFEQPGAGHHGQLLAKQAHAALRGGAGHAVAQGQVHVRGVQVQLRVAGINANVDAGVIALEFLQPGDEPHRCKAGPGGDGHAAPPGRLAHQPHGGVHTFNGRPHGAVQLCACAGQLHRTRVAQEQRHAHLVFQRLDLPADRRLGERQFIRRRAEVEVLGHGQKGAPVAGGNSPGADDGGGVFGRSHGV